MIKKFIFLFLPPIILNFLKVLKKKLKKKNYLKKPEVQELGLYFDPEMAKVLDTWGERNTWIEIQHLLYDKKCKILDIACGTGKVIEILSKQNLSDIYGCDISDFLIEKAKSRGIDKDKLKVCDATALPYLENEFDFCYSIGSLEHFTLEGITKFLQSSKRVTKYKGFHLIPVSKSNKDEGWIHNYQSYFNNSEEWWLDICKNNFDNVEIMDSSWEDDISIGKWLILTKLNK